MSPTRKFHNCKAHKKEKKMDQTKIREMNAKESPITNQGGGNIDTGGGNIHTGGGNIYTGGGNIDTRGGSIDTGGGNIYTGDINANDERYKPEINEPKSKYRLLSILCKAITIGASAINIIEFIHRCLGG